ncbi:hypothetical protein BJ742DRAFT_854756 [Cladochytrium replicatum]|nr:hypothetical protein BJ742DRAFT_854756 [Cladochytrium replicatum]
MTNEDFQGGHVKVLEWWKCSGLEFKCNPSLVVDWATRMVHVDVFEWWFLSGFRLEYCEFGGHEVKDTEMAMNTASDFNFLKFSSGGSLADSSLSTRKWKNSSLELKYVNSAIDYASAFQEVQTLEWWKSSALMLNYLEAAIDHSTRNGNVDVLEWWKSSGVPLKYTTEAMDGARWQAAMESLDWWKANWLEMNGVERRGV